MSPDTLRFYERSGLLPRPQRSENGYRAYGAADLARMRLLLELRRLDLPLTDASRIAGWCHTGHCDETTARLPALLAEHRTHIQERIAGLKRLDDHLAGLERHLSMQSLPMVGAEPGHCCAAAAALDTDVAH